MATTPEVVDPKIAAIKADADARVAAADKAASEAVAALAAATAPVAAAPSREWPETMRLRPVGGDMRNPFTQQIFGSGESKKTVVDAWVKAQVEGGKLIESDD